MNKAGSVRAVAALVILLAFSGCAAPATDDSAPTGTGEPKTMAVAGIVQDATFAPIMGANVSLRFQELNETTDSSGRFAFPGLAIAPYVVDVSAAGFLPATLTAEPKAGAAGLDFILQRIPDPEPRNFTQHFHGFIDCAMETLIIGPSCDTLIEDPRVGGPSLFNDTTSYLFQVESGWQTIVLDLDFDAVGQPGFEGMRITLRGTLDRDALTGYEQYGRFSGKTPFSAHITPNTAYPDGTHPVPVNMTAFQADMYAQGRGWHTICQPPFPEDPRTCLLGVGAGINVEFDLYVTTFYVKPADPGWSFLTE